MGEPTDLERLLRGYLRTRRSLEDPALILPGRNRRETIEAVRRALEAPAYRAPEGDGERDVSRGTTSDLPPEPPPLEDGAPELDQEERDRLSREATAEEIRALPDLPTLESVAASCVRCPLHEERQNVVFGEGHPEARVVCVGEAPGRTEDRTGRPFVGPAGQLLDTLLSSAGFRREEVFICNVLKCRPPGNRNPRTEEIQQCSPYLHRQLQLLEPEVVVAFGTFASQTLLDARESLGRLRRQTHLYRDWPLVVTYHPAALLRNPKWTVPAWEDLQKVRRILDGADDAPRPADSERLQVDVFDADE
jgi:DNA polymerase